MFGRLILRYYRGEGSAEKVARFIALEDSINGYREQIASLSSDIRQFTESRNGIMKAVTGSSEYAMRISLDNARFVGTRSSIAISESVEQMLDLSKKLKKAEASMQKMIKENPDMASIICDKLHDIEVVNNLDIIGKAYADGSVSKEQLIGAYNSAEFQIRLEEDLDAVLDKYLKDK